MNILRELHEQYKTLRESNAVENIQLNCVAGVTHIRNRNVINLLLDTLIAETQGQLVKQLNGQ